ncbi:MAG: hypothetical protein AAFR45_08040 [Pseudomonadota bacterium]
MTKTILILGSGPAAVQAEDWPADPYDAIVAINNAWRIRTDWTHLIHPEDFPQERHPAAVNPDQNVITAQDYVPHQNRLGGFVYAGGTMAFTAGYWALSALKPDVIAFFGCDMVYPKSGQTHFYGSGAADPLRADVSLRSLEAKAARLMLMAAHAGCRCVNLSQDDSRLVFPRARFDAPRAQTPAVTLNHPAYRAALRMEAELGYMVPSGRYWESKMSFDLKKIDALDMLWRYALQESMAPENVKRRAIV